MKGIERVSTARKNVRGHHAEQHEQHVAATLLRRAHRRGPGAAGHEDRAAATTCGSGRVRCAVGATERRELVVEVADRVGSALLPASPEDRRHEHRDPENAQNQDDRNRQGKRPRLCRPKSECNRLLATRCGSQPPTARFAAVEHLSQVPRRGSRPGRRPRVRDRGRRRGPRRAGGRCRNGRRSSPRAPARRSSCSGRSTCTCRRW